MRLRRPAFLAAGLAVSAVFLYLAFRRVPLSSVTTEIAKVDAAALAASVLTQALGLLFAGARTRALLRPIGRLSLLRGTGGALLALAGNNVLPFRLGELMRIDYVARHGRVAHSSCLAVVAFERLVDLSCLLALALVLVLTTVLGLEATSSLYVGVAAVAGALALAIAVGRRPEPFVRLFERASRVLGTTVSALATRKVALATQGLAAASSPGALVSAAALTLAYWATALLTISLRLWAFHLTVPWYTPALVVALLTFGSLLPSAPAYVGTYHYFGIAALTLVGVDRATASSFALVAHAVAVIPLSLLAVAVLFRELVRLGGARSGTKERPSDASGPTGGTR